MARNVSAETQGPPIPCEEGAQSGASPMWAGAIALACAVVLPPFGFIGAWTLMSGHGVWNDAREARLIGLIVVAVSITMIAIMATTGWYPLDFIHPGDPGPSAGLAK